MTKQRVYGYAGVSTPEQAKSEKESIPAQVRDIEAAASHHADWDLIDILVVPGFSRDYHQFVRCRDEMTAQGIDAFWRLERLWQTRAIDLFVCRDADRFGRTSAILNTVIGELVDAGSRIYLLSKQLYIDNKNYTTMGALLGFQAADELARIRARYEMGMEGRFLRGISGAHPPFSHILVGKDGERHLELDTTKEAFWRDLAELLLLGIKFNDLGEAMAKRGHRQKTGHPYANHTLWRHLHSPFTFGHVARHFERKHGAWAFDESEPLPDEVEIRRDVIAPVWTGEQAERVKAELRRRSDIATGSTSPEHTHRYSGLLVCAECGYRLGYSDTRYCCTTRWTRRRDGGVCANIAYIAERHVDAAMLPFLRRCRESGDIHGAWQQAGQTQPPDSTQQRIAELQRQVERAEDQLREMVRAQAAETQGVVRRIRAEEVARLGQSVEEMNEEVARLGRLLESPSIRRQREIALDELRVRLPEGILAASDHEVNQFFFQLLGNQKFVVRDGEIVDVGQKKVRPGRA